MASLNLPVQPNCSPDELRSILGRILGAATSSISVATTGQFKSDLRLAGFPTPAWIESTQAFYEPSSERIVLFADRIPKASAAAVLAHELVHKNGRQLLNDGQWELVVDALKGWATADKASTEWAVYAKAHAKAKYGTQRRPEFYDEELFAYAVEEAFKLDLAPDADLSIETTEGWLARAQDFLERLARSEETGEQPVLEARDVIALAYALAQIERTFDQGEVIFDRSAYEAGRRTVTPRELKLFDAATAMASRGPLPSSPEFKAWFTGSAVVTDKGAPLVVYHGTNKVFDAFSRETAGAATGDPNAVLGFFFTTSASEAALYAHGEGANIVPVHLSIKRPYEATMDELVSLEAEDYEAMLEELVLQGYDGIVAETDDGSQRWYVAFEPTQIASMFDRNFPVDPLREQARQFEDNSSNIYSADDFDWTERTLSHDEFLPLIGGEEGLRGDSAINPSLSDLSRPVIVAEEPDGTNLWDGVHRAVSAGKLGLTEIRALVGTYKWGNDLTPVRWRTHDATEKPAEDTRQSDAFKNWFGQSKVVDSVGAPLKMFHGTNKSFSTFDPRHLGSFFSSSQRVASDYGDNVLDVYIALQSPLIVDAKGCDWCDIPYTNELKKLAADAGFPFKGYENGKTIDTDTLSRLAKLAGYDGLLVRNVDDAKSSAEPATLAVAFRSDQIRAAEGVERDLVASESSTSTDAFKSWFGDSKVVTESGQPLAVYHGTNAEFELFDPNLVGNNFEVSTGGFFFSSSKSAAKDYADDTVRERGGASNVIAVNLAIDNPLVINTDRNPDRHFDKARFVILNEATDGDHDGVVVNGVGSDGEPQSLYLVFEPDQIRRLAESEKADSTAPTQATAPRSIPAGLTSIGYRLLPRGDARRFKQFGTWEKDGVRVALSGDLLAFERGAVMKYDSDGDAMTVEGIITDPDVRNQGRARQALRDVIGFADQLGLTLYIEPVPLEPGAGISTDHLSGFYASLGFVRDDPSGKVLRRASSAPGPEHADGNAFSRWFGASKVVDGNGKPLVTYHGTMADFSDFDAQGVEGASFFSVNPEVAGQFGITAMESAGEEDVNAPQTMPVYLSIENPLVLDARDVMEEHNGRLIHKFDRMIAAVKRAKEAGHDGLHIRNVPEFDGMPAADQFAAFRPEQIKSAIGNSGAFNPLSPDIRFSLVDSNGGAMGKSEKDLAKLLAQQQEYLANPVAFFKRRMNAIAAELEAKFNIGAIEGRNCDDAKFFTEDGEFEDPEDLPEAARPLAREFARLDDEWAMGESGYPPSFMTGYYEAEQEEEDNPEPLTDRQKVTNLLMDGLHGRLPGEEEPLKSPRPTHQASTEPFRRWFGDSKVVDASGKPLVVYHGSGSSNIKRFKPGVDGAGWFAVSPALAGGFASEGGGGDGDTVYPVYLSLQNPLDTRTEAGRVVMREANEKNPDATTAEQLAPFGYDGVISDEWEGKYGDTGTTYLAFRPEQIKSAIGNKGAFDPLNPDIRFSQAIEPVAQHAPKPPIDTAAFQHWFSGSKVTDASGKPLVVYHGTAEDFAEFDPKRICENDEGYYGQGFYFTPRQDTASEYATYQGESLGQPPVVMPAYVSLQNPYVWPEGKKPFNTDGEASREFTARLKAKGHDGIIVPLANGLKSGFHEVIAFRPEQIKSAIGNKGAFDPLNPDIRFSHTGHQAFEPMADTHARIQFLLASTRPAQLTDLQPVVSGKTEKPGGTDPARHLSQTGIYRLGQVPLEIFVGNEEGDRYDGTVQVARMQDYARRDGAGAPPVIAAVPRRDPSGKLRILDGGHRISAARHRGDSHINAIVDTRNLGVHLQTIDSDTLPEDILDTLQSLYGEVGRDVPPTLSARLIPLSAFPETPLGGLGDTRGEAYARAMIGKSVPPVIVHELDWLDGRHRAWAARQEGREHLLAIDVGFDLPKSVVQAIEPIGQLGLPNATPSMPAWFNTVLTDGEVGQPLKLFHGTRSAGGLEQFIPGGPVGADQRGDAYGVGAYLTTSQSEASVYAGAEGAVLPVYVNGRVLDVDAPLSAELQSQMTALAQQYLLPSDKARFGMGRKQQNFDNKADAQSFFDAQRLNWEAFGDRMERCRPEVVSNKNGRFVIEYADYDAPLQIQTPQDLWTLLKAVGFEVVRDYGYDGIMMTRGEDDARHRWVVMYNTLGTIKSAIGNNGDFNPYDPRICHSLADTSAEEPPDDDDVVPERMRA